MVVIKIWGGLGNQMFQYAFYKALLDKGKRCKLDISYYNYFNPHNGYELERLFQIEAQYATWDEIKKLANAKLDYAGRLMLKVHRKRTHYIQNPKENFGFDSTLLQVDDGYIQGYFYSEKYFFHIEEDIRKDFFFKEILPSNEGLLLEIENSNSIGIHIRRGDYVNSKYNLSEVCNIAYYERAIEHTQERVFEPKYYIFSDDLEWCRNNLPINNAVFVDINRGKDSYMDMCLMSRCKHNIIGNSSFSWWGAWLNGNAEKIIVSPKQWTTNNKIKGESIIPSSWCIL